MAAKRRRRSVEMPGMQWDLEANPELSDKVLPNCPKCEHRFEIPAQPKQCAKGEAMMDANHIRGPKTRSSDWATVRRTSSACFRHRPFIHVRSFPEHFPDRATALIVCSVAGTHSSDKNARWLGSSVLVH